MQIAQLLAGYTLGGADLLRRAMGKKKPEEMAQAARDLHYGGATERGVAEAYGYANIRSDGEICGLRLQQVAFGRLRSTGVSDGLSEGALSGGVHGGRDECGPRQHGSSGNAQGRLP